MRKFAATFKLTYFKKLKARSFIISTLIMMLIITGGANLDKIVKLFNGGSENVAIVTQDKALYQQLKGQLSAINKDVSYQKLSEDDAKKQIKQEKIDQAYVLHENEQHTLAATILSTSSPSDKDKASLQAVLTQLQTQKIAQDLGLQGNDLQRLQSQSQIDNTIIQKSGQENSSASEDEEAFAQVITMAGTFLMFFIVFNYAQQIATEVATEKTSRVSEMIITSVKPTTHIMAKIAGILALAFTQIVILALTFVANYFIFDLKSMMGSVDLSLTPHLIRLIIFGVIFLILGILSYVILASILGNLTARIEDLAQSLMPMTFLIMAAFYAGYFGAFNPDNIFIHVMSYVPFFSPFVTFSRLALTTTPTIEGIIAVVIHVVLIAVLLFLAAKSYKNAVLSFEKGWKNVLKRAFQREQ
ncbi:ABC transporter permease [Staphylococcus intermedius]|uniref:ABC-type Na+ efflux pump permease component n=1 Tax=Staphylococcus intermedius NCTC 11048 TaxID=1141106 RepID=A0A380G638_STAIN|nr:ABC transporter permease [Staphylococcus intermedius]PCF63784.1 sodium ABC transporter permease [Staphylococcus intermedius]PCF78499.1 sodium ABC transporter permease [Staphylococcus intermedius]PCF79472.1 sodium ABC transporter permease [Staphylococcus intermedius]PCF86791.1 sodium ABC transporter permease [Staphylococcus intermedius]PCF89871.1 sodium ABC transporter permease [Staphylococcus intermedius]